VYTPVHTVAARSRLHCDQLTTVTLSSHAHDPLGLAASAKVSACADQRFVTNFHRIWEARTLGNSLRAGYLSVRMAGGASDRH